MWAVVKLISTSQGALAKSYTASMALMYTLSEEKALVLLSSITVRKPGGGVEAVSSEFGRGASALLRMKLLVGILFLRLCRKVDKADTKPSESTRR